MSVSSLKPTILSILSAPGTDLQTISAKRVRKLLPEHRPDITPEFVKTNKEEIDGLIGRIYETITQGTEAEVSVSTISKRKRETTPEEEDTKEEDYNSPNALEESVSYTSTPVISSKTSELLRDAAYAKQLSADLNQRPTRMSRNESKIKKKSSTKASQSKKSRSRVTDSDDENEVANDTADTKPKTSRSKKSNGVHKAKGGFAKEFALSEPLSIVVGTTQLSRPQVVKRLWEYIKSRELQNPDNKKEIFCDDSLRNVFSTNKIDMFTMNKVLSNHLYELNQ